MKHIRSLYRSPLKTAITLLLLSAAAFLFLYNLSEYSVSDREYREARDRYEGVLTVEVGQVEDNTSPFDIFLLTDETGRTPSYGKDIFNSLEFTYEASHQQSLSGELMEKLASLPHISRVEKRYLTAGVSPEYYRLDTDIHYYPFAGRLVLEAIVAAEKLEVTEEDMEEGIRKLAERYSMEADKVREFFDEESMENYKKDLATQKALDLIVAAVK